LNQAVGTGYHHGMLHNLPATSGRRLAVRLHSRAERAVLDGHPWVFADGIRQQRHGGAAGDLAVLFDRGNRFLAIGLYDPDSPIRVRVLHRGDPVTIDGAWLAARIKAAHDVRAVLSDQGTSGYRIVHGENDGLPGLVIDRYDASVVIKLYTAAWFPWLNEILAAIDGIAATATAAAPPADAVQPRGAGFRLDRVVLRLSRAVARVAASRNVELRDGQLLHGDAITGPVRFQENGLDFEADLVHGQKTGFFLDQRDNRARVERFADGRSVLNVFAYSGGFSVYAARGAARSVTSLDLSEPALAAAERNFQHNRSIPAVAAAHHHLLVGDAFEVLSDLRRRGDRFDVVIIDPPSFAKARSEVERALGSYARIIRLGVAVLEPRGLLVAASCSSRISADMFRQVVEQTVHDAGLTLHVLQQTGHPLDHPVGFPEGEYLKCIFATISPRTRGRGPG
jgi:23S rRNA (cytosine1962-C5)-methyltransferase